MLDVGTRVFWVNQVSAGVGTILKVIPGDGTPLSYEVDFGAGSQRVPGSELQEVRDRNTYCTEKNRLSAAHQNAFQAYLKALKELTDAAGMMVHTEFEFLHRKLKDAREFARAARERFDEHTAEHRC
jgi:hypothetical protein